ncbi:MAG TPA: STAS domain-containing protein, partial [Bacteroidetes bacterium]|nr:STAS domain-containing protein [Bacteroidota bacterium]
RTAVNDQAGAKTGIAGMISASMIMLTLLFLTPLFHNLPKAILGSIVMVAVSGLIDIKEVKYLWRSNKRDFSLLLVAFFATLTFDPVIGIEIGVILSLILVIFRTTRPHVAVLGNVPGTHFYRNIERFDNLIVKDEILIVRFDAQLYFANADYFKEKIEALVAEKGPQLKLIILNAESINNLDSSAVHALAELVRDLNTQGIEIAFTGVKGPVRDAMAKGGIIEVLKNDHFFMSVQEAVDCYELACLQSPKKKNNLDDYTLQTNV